MSYAGQEKEERYTVNMVLEIDFNSDEAIYIQLRNQIILGIATNRYREGDVLPSVRQLADETGINMLCEGGPEERCRHIHR